LCLYQTSLLTQVYVVFGSVNYIEESRIRVSRAGGSANSNVRAYNTRQRRVSGTRSLKRINETNFSNRPATVEPPPQFSPEYILNPLAIYRMARNDIQDQEKHAPEHSSSAPSSSKALMSITSGGLPQAVPVQSGATPCVEPAGSAGFLGSWFEGGSSNMIPLEDGFQLPSSFDNLQAYFPLMYNNFSLPSDFSDVGSSNYPAPPDAAAANMPMQTEYAAMNLAPRWG
jgi:hypothetical protein